VGSREGTRLRGEACKEAWEDTTLNYRGEARRRSEWEAVAMCWQD
jgi:hypothetical protein